MSSPAACLPSAKTNHELWAKLCEKGSIYPAACCCCKEPVAESLLLSSHLCPVLLTWVISAYGGVGGVRNDACWAGEMSSLCSELTKVVGMPSSRADARA